MNVQNTACHSSRECLWSSWRQAKAYEILRDAKALPVDPAVNLTEQIERLGYLSMPEPRADLLQCSQSRGHDDGNGRVVKEMYFGNDVAAGGLCLACYNVGSFSSALCSQHAPIDLVSLFGLETA
jgi:hypothetical protein